jgi:hypothetical protein
MSERVAARKADVEWRSVDDEIIVLDLRSQRYLSLNKSGAVLWPMLVDGAGTDRLADELTRRYGVDPTVAARDVEELLTQLRAADLLEPEHAGAPTDD